ncbi:MAG: hypothetical protein EBT88_04590 [Proteobacteria bacterium]|nr:hypothetical protein [Pseudomonadota bacterium]
MAAQLQKTFNAETSLIKGGGGDFDVYVDNVVIFSKKRRGVSRMREKWKD